MHRRGTRGRLAPVIVTALICAVGCGGGGGSVKQDGTEIQNADEVLESADDVFADLTASGVDAGTTTISEDSRCYFLRDGADDIDSQVFCGPVRMLTGDDDEAWLALPTDSVEDPEGGLILSVPPTDDVASTSVAVDDLFRPDGQEPIEVSALEEPQAPEAPVSDFATLVEGAEAQIEAEFSDLSEPYRLITPSATLTVVAQASLDVVPASVVGLADGGTGDQANDPAASEESEDASVPFYRPAEGQQVRAWRVTIDTPAVLGPEIDRGFFSGNDEPTRDASTVYALGSGSQRLSITGALMHDGTSTATIPCEEVPCPERNNVQYVLVASGAADTAPTLIATVDGTDQTLDLDSGELTSDVSRVSYLRNESFQQVSTTWGDQTVHLADEEELCDYCEAVDYSYGGAVDRVYLSPFAPSKGWAPSGQAWLFVPIHDDPSSLTGDLAEATIDFSKSWSLATDGETISHDPDATVGHTAAFLVDESFTTGTFTYQPHGHVGLGAEDRNYAIEAEEPLTVDIAFP